MHEIIARDHQRRQKSFGDPIPSFTGEPVCVSIPEMDTAALADAIWAALNEDNKVSLYISVGDESVIINKYQ